MKPTYGRCSRFGIVAFASSLDQAGPLTRTVRDCAIMLQHMAGYDPNDSTSADVPMPDLEAALTGDVRGLRVGIPNEYRLDGTPAAITRALAGRRRLAAGGGLQGPRDQPAAHQIRAAGLLHRQSGRGVVQPRALRRHALRAAGRGPGPDRHLRQDPRRRLRQGGAPARHDRHLRALGRLLRRVLSEGAEGAHPDQARLRAGVRAGRPGPDPGDAERRRSASARRWTTRSRCG